MTHISGWNSEAIRPLAAPERTQGAPKVQRPDEDSQSRQPKAMMDEYVPEEPEEPSGRYWIGREQDGRPKIHFDDPERAAGAPNKPEEKWACDTGKVDREIEKQKKKQQELKQQLGTETDEGRIKELERQLAQTEQELREKDNDTYRKQHSTFTKLS